MLGYQTDEEILGISDDAPEVSSESAETSAPIESETTSQETAEQTPLSPTTEKAEALPAQKPADKTQPQAKPADQSQGAATYQELFPQGVEQARMALQKAEQFDKTDEAFLSGDHGAMSDVLSEMFAEKPEMALEAGWANRAWLEQYAPEKAAEFNRLIVADELGKQGLWNFLESAFTSAQTEQERAAWNQLAGFLNQKYGLGPQASGIADSKEWGDYRSNVASEIAESLTVDIKNNLPPEFPSLPAQEQSDFLSEVHDAIQFLVKQDRNLGSILKDAFRNGLTRESGIKVAGILHAKARAVLPAAIRRVMKEYGEVFKQARPTRPATSKAKSQPAIPAKTLPTSWAEVHSKRIPLSQVIEDSKSELEQADADNVLGLEEASRMLERDVLASPRRADLTRPEQKARKITRSEAIRSRAPFRQLLDDALEVTDQ
jgi:hypothetical protein